MINILNGAVGWSLGYQYTQCKIKEDEVKQGKNYYLAAAAQAEQVSMFGDLLSKTLGSLYSTPLSLPVKIACNLSSIIFLPISLLNAGVKSGDYKPFARQWNRTRKSSIRLPQFGNFSSRVMRFFAEHTGDLLRLAMIASSIALIALGKRFMGGGVLAALSYQAIDSKGFIPRKISLFMETYMPALSLVGIFAGGMIITKIVSAVMLTNYLFPSSCNRYIHYKVDTLFQKIFSKPLTMGNPTFFQKIFSKPLTMGNPTFKLKLEEVDAEIKQKEFDYKEFNEILNSNQDDFEINPAHCSKWVYETKALPESRDFASLLTLFNGIDWQNKYALIKDKLKDDDRFIDFLMVQFPQIDKKDLKNDFDDYVKKIAAINGKKTEEFAAEWMSEQMARLVDALLGKKRVKGSQQDLSDAMDDLAKLLPHLHSLTGNDQIELEDALLKLTVEGGDYCARGIKRAADELLRGVLQSKTGAGSDPVKDYQNRILQALQNTRHQILQSIYDQLITSLGNGGSKVPNAITYDTHTFDIYRKQLSLGFFPLTAYERNSLGVGEIIGWKGISLAVHPIMYSNYKMMLDDIFEENGGEVQFTQYLLGIIQNNSQLTDQEKNDLVEMYTERNGDLWSVKETNEKFHRCLFVKWGILRRKS